MSVELWQRLAAVFAAAGTGVICALLFGTAVVPLFRRVGFVSRESRIGVAGGRQDRVAMGGGFILLLGVTATVLLFTAVLQIRRGYAGVFLIAFWGFGLLGWLDDRSKAKRSGFSDRAKIVLQTAVTLLFAVVFQLYVSQYIKEPSALGAARRLSMGDLGLLNLPFVGHISLGLGYVPFVMLFLFWVSNAVNITDGFNGLAGGTGAIVALAYAVVTFLIGAAELHTTGDTGIARRMFALSVMSAALSGSLVAYLYFNFHKGVIYFGDTGSMALGAALAFLALFSRTEFLFLVIGGVFFIEAGSVFLQRLAVACCQRFADPLMLARMEPVRPFVIAPLHHHFEHLMMREWERQHDQRETEPQARERIRRRITVAAWKLSLVFAALGVLAQYGLYRSWRWLYDWSCVVGVLLGLVALAAGVLTRLLYDCYFIGPDEADPELLTLYRGIPYRFLGRRLFHVYERTDIPVSRLGSFEQRTGLLRLLSSRVDARTWFGLLHYQCAERTSGEQRRQHIQAALRFWGEVPRDRFLVASRENVLYHMAECYRAEGEYGKAVECLNLLYRRGGHEAALSAIEELERESLAAAESAYAAWAAAPDDDHRRQAALATHEQLLDLLRMRFRDALEVRERMDGGGGEPEERIALDHQIELLQSALDVTAGRCDRLQPSTEVAQR